MKRLKELALRASGSQTSLPSASCFTFQNYGLSCSSACFSGDFSLLAAGTTSSYIDVWGTSGNKLRALKPSTELAGLDLNSLSSIEDVLDSEESYLKRLVGHAGTVSGIVMNKDGSALLSSSFDCTLRLWSMHSFSSIALFHSHAYPVWDCDLSPLGHYFVSGSADRTARVWNMDYSDPVRLLAGHYSDVDVVRFHPNGCYIATGSSDKSARLWDLATGNCVRLFSGHMRGVCALSFSKNGKLLATGDQSGRTCVYNIGEGRLVWRSDEPPSPTKPTPTVAMDFSNDDRHLAVSYSDGRVRLLSTEDLNRKPTDYFTKQTPIYALRFSPRDVLMCAGPYLPE